MKQILTRVFCAVGIVVFAMTSAQLALADGEMGRKYAILVGVKEYDRNQLKNLPFAENDVAEMAEILNQSGFPLANSYPSLRPSQTPDPQKSWMDRRDAQTHKGRPVKEPLFENFQPSTHDSVKLERESVHRSLPSLPSCSFQTTL